MPTMPACNVQPMAKGVTKYHVQAADVGNASNFANHATICANILRSRFDPSRLDQYVKQLVAANAELPLVPGTSTVSGLSMCLICPKTLEAGLVLSAPAAWESAWPGQEQEEQRNPDSRLIDVDDFRPKPSPVNLPLNRAASDDEDMRTDDASMDDDDSASPWLIAGVAALAIGGAWWAMTRK